MKATPEIVVAVLGTVLTAASVVASYYQFRAADLQAKAAVVALQPQLQVRAPLERGDDGKFADRRLEIVSDGGPVYNLTTERHTWFDVMTPGHAPVSVALEGYWFAVSETGRIKGEVLAMTGHRNHAKFVALADSAKAALNPCYELGRPTTLLRVTYVDSLRQSAIDYYLVEHGSVTRLSEERGSALWAEKPRATKSLPAIDLDQERGAGVWEAWALNVRARIPCGRARK